MLIRDRSEGESPDQECPKDIPRLSGLTDEQPLPVPQPFTDFLLGSPRVKAADPARGLEALQLLLIPGPLPFAVLEALHEGREVAARGDGVGQPGPRLRDGGDDRELPRVALRGRSDRAQPASPGPRAQRSPAA